MSESTIQIVEPSDDISISYSEKSQKTLISAKTLLKIEHYEDAVALTYFSMYYSALALLYKCGIKSENHTGTIILLKEIFSIDNREIALAKKERVDKQYYVDFKAYKDDVIKGITSAEKFNAEIKNFIDKIQTKEQQQFCNKMKEF